MASIDLPDALDIVDEFQQDEDNCTEEELNELFPIKYQASKKVVLVDGFQTSNTFVHLVVNEDESVLAAANKKGDVSLIDVQRGTVTSNFEAHSKEITGLRFCPKNPNILYSSSLDSTVKLRDLRSDKFEYTYEHKDEEGIGKEFTCLDVNCTGEFLCSGTSTATDEDAYLIFWDVRNSNKMLGGYSESHSDDITNVSFHPSKRQTLASAAMDNLINVYDISKKTESDAFSYCINFETTPDAIHWDPHTSHQNKLFAVNYPQMVQYWDIDGTVPTADLGPKKLCKAIKRQRSDQCHLVSLNFDKDLNPLLMVSSNLGCESQENACVRTLFYDRQKKKVKPHGRIELVGNKIVQLFDSLYLTTREVFVTLEGGSLRYWTPPGYKRAGSDAHGKGNKKQKH